MTLYARPRLEESVCSWEILFISEPTLKVASFLISIAGESDLGSPPLEDINNFSVRDVAHLVVLMYYFPILIAYASLLLGHESIACVVFSTYVAINTCPAIVAFTIVPTSHRTVLSISQGPTYYIAISILLLYHIKLLDSSRRTWRQAVIPTESSGTGTFAVVLIAVGILAAGESWEETIETAFY
jgi:hypothetical protein